MPHRVPLYGGSCVRNQKANLNRGLKPNINHCINSILPLSSISWHHFPRKTHIKSGKIWIQQFRNAFNYLPLLNTLKWGWKTENRLLMFTGYTETLPTHPACLSSFHRMYYVSGEPRSCAVHPLVEMAILGCSVANSNTAGRCRARALNRWQKEAHRKKGPGNCGSLLIQCPVQLN